MVAARGSRLSLAQARLVIRMLQHTISDVSFEILTVSTHGDKDSRPMFQMDRRGMFEREVNQAISEGRADFAVHSMKDVPGEIAAGLELASVPVRANPYDIMVCRPDLDTTKEFVVGTSSLRRAAQARLAFERCVVRPIRGNVDTRVSRVGDTFDAVILARAGLERLGLDIDTVGLSDEVFIPSPGQGALALVCRADDHHISSMLGMVQDSGARAEAEAERALSHILESGCRFPVAACARYDDGVIRMRAAAYDHMGGVVYAESDGIDPVAVGQKAGHALLDSGAASFALKWRQSLEEWR